MRPEKIITHANCPDGIASALVLSAAYPDVPVQFVAHNTPEHEQPACRAIWCDMCPPESTAEQWLVAGAVVLDHHKTAKEIVTRFQSFGQGIFADEKERPGVSGGVLAYHHTLEIGRPDDSNAQTFATLVGIRDTWQKESPLWAEACSLSAGLMFYGFKKLKGVPIDVVLSQCLSVGELVVAKRTRLVEEIVATHKPFWIRGKRVLLFQDGVQEKLSSDVGELARARGVACDLSAGFWYNADGSITFSLRSVADGVDVSAIAKANGGGGHTKAAGFTYSRPRAVDPVGSLLDALDI